MPNWFGNPESGDKVAEESKSHRRQEPYAGRHRDPNDTKGRRVLPMNIETTPVGTSIADQLKKIDERANKRLRGK